MEGGYNEDMKKFVDWLEMEESVENTYTIEEISQHNQVDDCWLLIDGIVYNVTPFIEEHPGGSEIMIQHANGTDVMNAFEEAEHSTKAKNGMTKYRIGMLKKNKLDLEKVQE